MPAKIKALLWHIYIGTVQNRTVIIWNVFPLEARQIQDQGKGIPEELEGQYSFAAKYLKGIYIDSYTQTSV